LPNNRSTSLTVIPLARWASRRLGDLARLAATPAIARLSGEALLGERAMFGGFAVPGRTSPGGGCRLIEAGDGWIALNLARDCDRELLPAWFEEADFNPGLREPLDRHIRVRNWEALVARGREMGLAVAGLDEVAVSPASAVLATGGQRHGPAPHRPLVVDLSALWAGPLAGHLLWLAGAQVLKVESRERPDALRHGDPALFALLNQGKASIALDFRSSAGQAALRGLLAQADIVIEASRPRALRQLDIKAEALLAQRPGQVWLTITGHGASGVAADWVGFGDDCAVAGGLSAALRDASGAIGFGGDAPADPLTGIFAALEGWKAFVAGQGRRIGLSMSGVTALALRDETELDGAQLDLDLRGWSEATGRPFPPIDHREVTGEVQSFGASTSQWLGRNSP
jgi:hypothetical protein